MYLSILAVLLIIAGPLSLGASAYMWRLHQKVRQATDDGAPRIRLSLIMALTGTLAAVAAILIGLTATFYLAEQDRAAALLWPFTLGAFAVLDVIPIINAAYLRSLERDHDHPWP